MRGGEAIFYIVLKLKITTIVFVNERMYAPLFFASNAPINVCYLHIKGKKWKTAQKSALEGSKVSQFFLRGRDANPSPWSP